MDRTLNAILQEQQALRRYWAANTELSTRAINALVELGIDNFDALENLDPERLKTVRRCGVSTRNEIASYILHVIKKQPVPDVPDPIETALRSAWKGLCARMVHDPHLILPARSVARALALLGASGFTTNEESPE